MPLYICPIAENNMQMRFFCGKYFIIIHKFFFTSICYLVLQERRIDIELQMCDVNTLRWDNLISELG